MAVKANVILKTLGEKLGLAPDQVTKLTANASLSTIDIEDDIAKVISETEVFTADAAASNSKIRGKIRAEVLDGIDSDSERLALKHGLSEDEIKEIKKLDKTSAKLEKYYEKISEAVTKKATASGKQKTELEKEIEELNGKIKSTRDEYEGKIASMTSQFENDRINYAITERYNSLDFAVPEGVKKEDFIIGAKAIMDRKFTEKGIKFKLTETGLAPFNSKEDTPYFDNNIKITASDLITKVANESKLLKVSGSGAGGGQQRKTFKHADTGSGGNGEIKISSSRMDSLLEESTKRDFGQ